MQFLQLIYLILLVMVLEKARKSLIKKKISFPEWNADIIENYNNYFNNEKNYSTNF